MAQEERAVGRVGYPEDPQASWEVFTHKMFPEGSLGDKLFPKPLEGRRRPPFVFTGPIPTGYLNGIEKTLAEKNVGVHNLLDLLFWTQEGLPLPTVVKDILRVYLENHMISLGIRFEVTPHGRLVGAAFGGSPLVVKPQRESGLMRTIDGILNSVRQTDSGVVELLRERYGFEDWTLRDIQSMAVRRGRSQQEIKKQLSKGLDLVRSSEGFPSLMRLAIP